MPPCCSHGHQLGLTVLYHHTTPSNASKRKASESDSDNESEDDSSQTDINPYMPLANKYEILTSDGMAHQTPKNTKFQAPLIAGLRRIIIDGNNPTLCQAIFWQMTLTNIQEQKNPKYWVTDTMYRTKLNNGDKYIKGEETVPTLLHTQYHIKFDTETAYESG